MISKGSSWTILFVDETNLISLIFGGLIFIIFFFVYWFLLQIYLLKLQVFPKKVGCFILIIIGTYSYSNYGAHVLMALILGFLGYIFIKVNIPPIPIVLGFVMAQSLNRIK